MSEINIGVANVVLFAIQVLLMLPMLPFWGHWRKIKSAPEKVSQLEVNFVASLAAQKAEFEKFKVEVREEIKEKDNELEIIRKGMNTIQIESMQSQIKMTEILGEIKGTLQGLNIAVDNLNLANSEHRDQIRRDIGDLRERINSKNSGNN